MATYCRHCGKEFENDINFCPICGEAISYDGFSKQRVRKIEFTKKVTEPFYIALYANMLIISPAFCERNQPFYWLILQATLASFPLVFFELILIEIYQSIGNMKSKRLKYLLYLLTFLICIYIGYKLFLTNSLLFLQYPS
jgi:uncharacterized membrane protein YvbJ